ncbi:MAG TPA: hypothetical protein VIM75_18015 [Ohtaekwangia sp.]|uniref:hypothetical protein n=1 Tax=Ohtaekwangia sp. TaxID=2066019 RepID=UPI002F95F6D2
MQHYDDKPGMYSNIAIMPLPWNNSDAAPILAALNTNNPLDYHIGTQSYQYIYL